MEPQFQICYEPNLKDTIHASRMALRIGKKKHIIHFSIVFFYGVFLLSMLYLDSLFLSAFSLIYCFFMIAMRLFYPDITARKAFKKATAMKDDNGIARTVYLFFDDAMETENVKSSTRSAYSVFVETVETPLQFVLLLEGRAFALFIPKSGFEIGTPEAFGTFIAEKVGTALQKKIPASTGVRIALLCGGALLLALSYLGCRMYWYYW